MSTLVLSKSYTVSILRRYTQESDNVDYLTGEIKGIGPTLSYERWKIDRIQTTCDSAAQSRLYVYLGQPTEPNLVSGTYSGNFDTDETTLMLNPGDTLSFKYDHATGANGSLYQIAYGMITLRGTIEIAANIYGSRR